MAIERTNRSATDIRTEAQAILSDTSGVFTTPATMNDAMEAAAGDITHDIDALALPHLRVQESLTTIAGHNQYDLTEHLSQTIVKLVCITRSGFPVLPMTWADKLAVYGNTSNCGDTSGMPRFYDRGNGEIEIYSYGTGFPETTFVVDYVKRPALPANSRLEMTDQVANCLLIKTVHRLLVMNRRLDIAESYLQEY